MNPRIKNPGLLQCSRVDVLDVRPVIEQGKEPFDSIQYSFSSLSESKTLLIVAPFEPTIIQQYLRQEKQSFSCVHDEVTNEMHWLAVHAGTQNQPGEIKGPSATYVLPGGEGGQVAYLDGRELDLSTLLDWANSTLQEMGPEDLIVLHTSGWNVQFERRLEGGTINRNPIVTDHVRLEIEPNE